MHQWFFQSNQLFHEVPKPPDLVHYSKNPDFGVCSDFLSKTNLKELYEMAVTAFDFLWQGMKTLGAWVGGIKVFKYTLVTNF